MTTMIAQIQADRRTYMKSPNPNERAKASLLGVLIADATRNDKTPDTKSVQATIRSTIKKLEVMHKHSDAYHKPGVEAEIVTLQQYMPEQVPEPELRDFIASFAKPIVFGKAMGEIKGKYGTAVDMKMAAKILKEDQ